MGHARLLAQLVAATRVHDAALARRGGREAWVKRRRPGMGGVIACGNLFLKWSRSRIRMFARAADWRAWELECFALLHGGDFRSGPDGADGVWLERMPGRPMRGLLEEGALGEGALRAAALELRRCHALACARLGGPWSHGDPHLANLLFDAASGRARLIDFETVHEPGLAPAERHADDLLVLLLDLAGRAGESEWLRLGRALVGAYARPDALERLRDRLRPPAGLERVLWVSRAACADPELLRARVEGYRRGL